ncbi:MAG: C40 family peptidase, partial [Deltaproteobacteria bacterium]|nr:C40 family peptidase [Deltaproteobacteria bacterium]
LQKDGEHVDENMIRANNTDCSGFIKMIYEESGKSLLPVIQAEEKKLMEKYGPHSKEFQTLDRGAELLRRAAEPVSPENIKEGDLVFFKDIKNIKKDRTKDIPPDAELTEYATHVGIVSKVDTNKNGEKKISFIHKSTNGGVVESELDSRARTNCKIFYKDLNPSFGRIK